MDCSVQCRGFIAAYALAYCALTISAPAAFCQDPTETALRAKALAKQDFLRDLEAANASDRQAEMRVAKAYYEGTGVRRDGAEAARRLEILRQEGSIEATAWLGSLYLLGRGVAQDFGRALTLIQPAANAGDPVGLRFLGLMYETGRGVEQDFTRAAALYQLAAAKHDPNSHYKLGNLYLNGLGVPRSLEKAFQYFSEGAQLGDSWAQLNLGQLYLSGHVPMTVSTDQKHNAIASVSTLPDYSKALLYFTKSADQGNRIAAFKLGSMYAAGQGVEQDYKKSFNYYKLSASRQYVPALLALGEAHELGNGTDVNLVHAYVAYSLAAELSDPSATAKLQWVVHRLTPDQIEQGRQLLEQFKRQTGNN